MRVKGFFILMVFLSTVFVQAASSKEIKMTDLGVIGPLNGNHSKAVAINDAGLIAGDFQDTSNKNHGFVCEKGIVTEIPCSIAVDVNEKGQVLGNGIIWENGVITNISNLLFGGPYYGAIVYIMI